MPSNAVTTEPWPATIVSFPAPPRMCEMPAAPTSVSPLFVPINSPPASAILWLTVVKTGASANATMPTCTVCIAKAPLPSATWTWKLSGPL